MTTDTAELIAALKPFIDVCKQLVEAWHRDPEFTKHPDELGVTIKTNCGIVYAVAEAAKAQLAQTERAGIDIDNAREVFEDWITAGGDYPHLKHKLFGGNYLHEESAMKWDGFKAGYYARNKQQTPTPDDLSQPSPLNAVPTVSSNSTAPGNPLYTNPPLTNEQPGKVDKCPKCGGDADNGYDRCVPPNPYYCTKCENLTAAQVDVEALKRRIAELEAILEARGSD